MTADTPYWDAYLAACEALEAADAELLFAVMDVWTGGSVERVEELQARVAALRDAKSDAYDAWGRAFDRLPRMAA